MGGIKKTTATIFSLQLLQTQELAPKTFLLSFLTLWPHWCKISRPKLVPVQIIELEARAPLKKSFFWSNSWNIEIMITSLVEMLELPNFGHMTDHIYNIILVTSLTFVGDVMDRNYDITS